MSVEVTIKLPDALHQAIEAEARVRGESVDDLVVKELTRHLIPTGLPSGGERERVLVTLRKTGLVRPLSDHLRQLIIPGVTHEEVRHNLRRAGGKPLSQIVIEQRR